MYRKGEGLPEPDPVQALKWFRAAARQKDPAAIHNLAVMYHLGEGGLEPDLDKAAQLNLEAAELGSADAQFAFGVIYAEGIGVERDRREAVRWLREAANQDHPEAQNSLGVAYYCDGHGVDQGGAAFGEEITHSALQDAPPSGTFHGSTFIHTPNSQRGLRCENSPHYSRWSWPAARTPIHSHR